MILRTFYQSFNKMKKSTPICPFCNSDKSLCGCCEAENIISDKNWYCKEKGHHAFLNQCIFCAGKHLCRTGANPDCIYKYKDKYVVAIEIKDQHENSIDYNNLVKKIKNYYNCAVNQGLIPSLFILQISSIKNAEDGPYTLQGSCEYGLGTRGFTIGKNSKLFSDSEGLSHINCKFFVVKCSELTEDLFTQLL